MEQTKNIRKAKIAYKIGFSSALSVDTYSAYAELFKWNKIIRFGEREIRMFLLGWQEGYAVSFEFKKVFVDRIPASDDASVATLR